MQKWESFKKNPGRKETWEATSAITRNQRILHVCEYVSTITLFRARIT